MNQFSEENYESLLKESTIYDSLETNMDLVIINNSHMNRAEIIDVNIGTKTDSSSESVLTIEITANFYFESDFGVFRQKMSFFVNQNHYADNLLVPFLKKLSNHLKVKYDEIKETQRIVSIIDVDNIEDYEFDDIEQQMNTNKFDELSELYEFNIKELELILTEIKEIDLLIRDCTTIFNPNDEFETLKIGNIFNFNNRLASLMIGKTISLEMQNQFDFYTKTPFVYISSIEPG